ncbi:VanZ family protein [Brachybacterium avium]|uniref:VanZ family protein n=1 Tax=Brachybacterium avium TaxID=2017485 RepID=UPI0012FDB2B9|nr:VanZ family protein [Brachybacterium avium]
MDAVVDFLRRLPDEIGRVGGSLVWRAGLLALALLLNLGFYLPSLPGGVPGTGLPGLDKAVHLLVFALTVFAAGRLLAPRKRFPMGWIVVVALVHAPFIELVQLVALPQRSGDGMDILFDVIGIALGTGLWIGDRLQRGTVGLDQLEPEAEPATDGHR